MANKNIELDYYWCRKCNHFHLKKYNIFWDHLKFKIPKPKNWFDQKYIGQMEKLSKNLKDTIKRWKKNINEFSDQQNIRIMKILRALRQHLENQLYSD